MPRRVTIAALCAASLVVPTAARADQPEPPFDPTVLPDVGEAPGESVGERELGVALGLAIGKRGVSPGGLRLAGAYLYQLSEVDWFDGGIAVTFGSGGAECFRDRADQLVCDHGRLDGVGLELLAGVRRFFAENKNMRPWVRPAIGLRLIRFGDDDLTGGGLVAHLAGGVRGRVADQIAVGGYLAAELGGAVFDRDHGAGLQAAVSFGVTAEFELY